MRDTNHKLHIGDLTLDGWAVMAPMAGITNLPFRLMAKRMGAALVTTEMVSAVGLARGHSKTRGYLRSRAEEKPLAVQIFGSDPAVMASAAQLAVAEGADVIDINMGCPVKKVVKTGAGAALLRDTRTLSRILSAIRPGCPVPLTVKIRAGWSPASPVAVRVGRIAEDCGVDAITVHPRSAATGYAESADWTLIAQVKERVSIPVIGNGDIFDPLQAQEMRRKTGCDGVMIGRAAVGNPWIFKQILHLDRGLAPPRPTPAERWSLILEHFHLMSEFMGEHRAARAIRGLLLKYTRGLPHGSRFRDRISRISDLASLVAETERYIAILEEDGP